MTKRAIYIIAYDIADDRRRARALRAAKSFGMGGQKSVHECLLSPSEWRELTVRLKSVMIEAEDRLLSIRLDPRGALHQLGRGLPPADPGFVYAG